MRKVFAVLLAGQVAGFAIPTTTSAQTASDQALPMSGGYTNVIAIPVSDPAVKSIAGALF